MSLGSNKQNKQHSKLTGIRLGNKNRIIFIAFVSFGAFDRRVILKEWDFVTEPLFFVQTSKMIFIEVDYYRLLLAYNGKLPNVG